MTLTVSLLSFRRGTGKSNVIASLAAMLALRGKRVGIVDIDVHSPSTHILFNVDDAEVSVFLNDYLCGRAPISDAVQDVTSVLARRSNGTSSRASGKLFLIPASPNPAAITEVIRECYDVQVLRDGLLALNSDLELDVLLLDTHAGINEQTLLAASVSDLTFMLLRLDQQEFQGTAVMVELIRNLESTELALVINDYPPHLKPAEIKKQTESSYATDVAAVMAHTNDLLTMASRNIFSLIHPHHPWTQSLEDLYEYLDARM